MPTMNVLYDPNWEAVHDHHAAERERLGKLLFGDKCDCLTGAAAAEAQAEFDRHHLECLLTFKTQHETVQEYARWLFSIWTAGGPRPEVDYEALRSVEEARDLYNRLVTEAEEAKHAERASLPVGQPPALRAFEGEGMVRCWRHFTPGELRSCGAASLAGTRTLMTSHRLAGVWHVCFMQDGTYPGKSVINAVEILAMLVYREARAEAAACRALRPGWVGWLGRLVPDWMQPGAVRPSSFRFYTHLPPVRPLREEFDRVELRFAAGQFMGPKWRGYRHIPQAVAAARGEVPLGRTARVRWLTGETVPDAYNWDGSPWAGWPGPGATPSR